MMMGRTGGAYELGPAAPLLGGGSGGGGGARAAPPPGLWSRRIAPRLRSREASPVRTRSARTMESSASVGWGPAGTMLDRRRGTRDGRGLCSEWRR